MSDETLRIVIADDHAIVREGIRSVLDAVDGFEVVAEASSGDAVMTLIDEYDPGLLVLDISMPGRTGLEVTKALRARGSEVRVLIHSMHDDPEYVLEAVRAGADGYILKDGGPAELRAAVAAVREGNEFLPERVTHQLSVGLREEMARERIRSRIDALTAREKEVLIRIARGMTNREMADEFGISPRTVETHRERVMSKLRIHTVAGLTRFVVEHELGE